MFDQLEQENAKLLADLAAYEKELGPKLAQKELDRQNRIVGLQTELEAYREIAKLRGPRAEKERQDRIAKAQAAIAENDKKLMAEAAEIRSQSKEEDALVPLEALEMGATYRANLRVRPTARSSSMATKRRAPIALSPRCRSIKSPASGSTRSPTTACRAKAPAAAPTATSSSPNSPPICCRRPAR